MTVMMKLAEYVNDTFHALVQAVRTILNDVFE